MKLLPDKQDILDSLAAIARGAGRAPSRSEFLSLSGISEHYVSQFFPSWSDAVRAAGLQPFTLNVRLEDSELLENWGYTVRRNRKIPARRAYRRQGKYDPRTIERRFGPWSALPEVFRNFAQSKPEWADVVALLPVPVPKPAANSQQNPLPNALPSPLPNPLPNPPPKIVGAQHAAPDNPRAPNQQSPSSPLPNKVLPNKALPNKLRYAPLEDRPAYGHPLDFRGLRHEPVNEQGVVLLFGIVAKELGYIVEAVQSGFPDCEAKRQIGPERWQRVHIEFEFESRNFRDHGHPPTGCDVIVCWRHNWDQCPAQIEVLELSTLVKSLPNSKD